VYLIEIVFLLAVVLTEQDSMVVEHYYKMKIVDYYYYWLEIDFDTIVVLVLVEMLAMNLNKNKKENSIINFWKVLLDGCHFDGVVFILLFCC